MQVKKFEAPTMQEALDNIKRELGPEAIILQTKQNRRGFGLLSKGSFEILAAVSERAKSKKEMLDSKLPDTKKNVIQKLTAEKQADLYDRYLNKKMHKPGDQPQPSKGQGSQPSVEADSSKNAKKITATRYVDIQDDLPPKKEAQNENKPKLEQKAKIENQSLEEEVVLLRKMIEELKDSQSQSQASGLATSGATGVGSSLEMPIFQDIFEQLLANGLERKHILALLKKVSFELGSEKAKNPENVIEVLAKEIMETIQVSSPFSQYFNKRNRDVDPPVVIALVGPTGVGKTTTAAKIAGEAIFRKNLRVGLINLDHYKQSAFEQLGTYAKILNIPFRSPTSAEDFRASLSDFRDLDLIIIDTTGRSNKDGESLKQIQSTLGIIPNLHTFLVLAGTTRDVELYSTVHRLSMFRPEGLIISKLDEASIFGAIYNLSQRVKLPLAFFTTGQKIPEDIEEATQERVAALIMDL